MQPQCITSTSNENCTLKKAQQMVEVVSSYCNETRNQMQNVKSSHGITSKTNGPQGNTALKTAVSLSLLGKGLESLDNY